MNPRIKYEEFVNIAGTLLQYDNLTGIIPDRLSYYFEKMRKISLTFPRVEAVSFS